MLLALGSTIFMGQFAFIVSGTFVFYSWDIMEPIAYTMLLANFTTGFFFYALKKQDMALGNLREIMALSSARRMYRRRGFDIQRYEKLQKEIIELRTTLNKSIY